MKRTAFKTRTSPLNRTGSKDRQKAGKPATAKRGAKKKPSVSSLKKLAWKQFSIFIRAREADSDGMVQCFTCSHFAHWKTLEAGHLVPGRTNAVLFNEDSVRQQCRRCNGHFRGNTIVYYPKLVGMLGQEAVDQIVAQKDVTHKWGPSELSDLLAKYSELNKNNPLVREGK